ncbi:MAG: Dabb family protein, partial [Rhodomicrobium sp.]|nr:Dabb family protein [Rhodomicrobium sp.]
MRHTVVFRLKHPDGSDAERTFLEDALVLTKIPTVHNFER